MPLTMADVWSALCAGIPPAEMATWAISHVVIDSRQVQPGDLFVALRGERTDGHAYVGDALAAGAVGALVDHVPASVTGASVVDTVTGQRQMGSGERAPVLFLTSDTLRSLQQLAQAWRARHPARAIGVTGSVGKTSTKEMIAAVLARRYHVLKSAGNYNNEIGLPLTLLELEPRHERLVLEMGMYALGEIAHLCALSHPEVGVVTNVGPTHLERLGTIARIAQAKAELVQALPAAPIGVAVLNYDDPRVRAMAQQTSARVFFYGLTPGCDLWADGVESEGLRGIRCRLHEGAETLHVKAPLLGRHSVHTILCAAAVGRIEGLGWDEIVAGLQDVSAQLRLVTVTGLRGATLIDDTYNASPVSMVAALNLLADLTPGEGGRRVAVLGDMLELGDYEEEGHVLVGRRAADVVDRLVTVGRRARRIGEEARAVGMAAENVTIVEDNEAAITVLRDLIDRGDLVLIKGSRGQQMEQIVAALAQRSNG